MLESALLCNRRDQFVELRERDGCTVRAYDLRGSLRHQARNREGHCYSMISRSLDAAPLERLRPLDRKAIIELFDLSAHASDAVCDGAHSITLFDSQLPRIADLQTALNLCRSHGQNGNLIDDVRNDVPGKHGRGLLGFQLTA